MLGVLDNKFIATRTMEGEGSEAEFHINTREICFEGRQERQVTLSEHHLFSFA